MAYLESTHAEKVEKTFLTFFATFSLVLFSRFYAPEKVTKNTSENINYVKKELELARR